MFAGVSGLRAHQTMTDVVANNIANVNTIGFKASRVQFADTLSQLVRGASGGTGEATGEDRAMKAASEAIANPLLDNITLSGAQGLLISIVGGTDLTLYEVDTAASHIRKEVAAEANIIVGATTEAGMDDRIRVSIVASGISGQSKIMGRKELPSTLPDNDSTS